VVASFERGDRIKGMAKPAPYFELRPSPIQGQGVFALRRIRKGTRVAEYVGERITPEEADARYDDDAMEIPHTFLFTVNKRVVIDGAVGGNDSRFINHSCDPNCETVDDGGRIFVETLRTIQPGEELTYDYHLERPGPYRREWDQRYACRCGAHNCRGTLLLRRRKKRTRV
jgi:SET domain-containing protein